jgi:hypothetical protein
MASVLFFCFFDVTSKFRKNGNSSAGISIVRIQTQKSFSVSFAIDTAWFFEEI